MKKKFIAKTCNFIGVLLMLIVIAVMGPLTVPKLFGYEIYAVLTGSMTPAYSVGSVVYVRECEAEEIEVGDVITYRLGTEMEAVMTHRVMEIDAEAGTFITKGDANDIEDPEPIRFERLVGKVTLCVPKLSAVSDFVNSVTGKIVVGIVFGCAIVLWVVAEVISREEKSEEVKEENALRKGKAVPKKVNRDAVIRAVLRTIGITLIVGSGIYLWSIFMEYKAGTDEYRELEALVFADVEELSQLSVRPDTEESPNPVEATETEENHVEPQLTEEELRLMREQIMQAVGTLAEENPDVIGWIVFDNMELSYPIMQGEDNVYYLNHTFSGEVNSAGSIFMEAANNSDFEDCHTIIYGHNMQNLSMFGRLKKYKTEAFYEDHQYFTIYTKDNWYRYQIFAYYDISEVGEIYTIGFGPDEVFGEFINNMYRRSYYDTGVKTTAQDKVITLSTCSTEGNRFVLNAKRLEE